MAGRIAFLLALALLHRLADVFSLPTLERLASATMASPAPVVRHCQIRAYVSWYDGRFGTEAPIRRDDYRQLTGPAARRKVFRTAVECGPVLEDDPSRAGMQRAVVRYAFCGEAPLLRAMRLDVPRGARLRLRHEPAYGRDDPPELHTGVARTTDITCR